MLPKPKHGVVHEIETKNHKPCKASVRPIMPGTQKDIDAKKTWFELEKLGVIERVGAGEPTIWSSPLHLAPKADGSLRPCGDYSVLNSKTFFESQLKFWEKFDFQILVYLKPMEMTRRTFVSVVDSFYG